MMKIRFITAILLQIAVISFAQTREDFYKSIHKFESNYVSIFKDNKLPQKEDFLLNAIIFPFHKFTVTDKQETDEQVLANHFYIVYDKRLYEYKNGYAAKKMGGDYIINYLIANKDHAKIGCFIDNVYYTGIELTPILVDSKNNIIVDSDKNFYGLLNYINFKYNSFESYKEKFQNEKFREQLTLKDINEAIKNNYKKFEYNCPKDTTLVIKTFINQVKSAVRELSKEQEEKLIERIKFKLNPIESLYKLNKKIIDVNTRAFIVKSKEENQAANKKNIKYQGDYDFFIYDINITNDLLTILTNKQFQDYKNYIDIRFPIINVNDFIRSSRYEYGREILEKEKIINPKNYYLEYKNYSQKILSDCGCPFDESIKREIIIR
jgi:uncharacterized protein involved in tolerance to divalent cations